MDIAKSIKELRESTGMSRKDFSEHTGIPVRTLEDWEAGRRTPPEYIPRLIAYQLKYEELVQGKEDCIFRNCIPASRKWFSIIQMKEMFLLMHTLKMKVSG